MSALTIDVDLPPNITITAYHRHGDGHGFEVSWPLPTRCCCDACHREEPAHLEFPDKVQVIRDLDIWGQPSFWIYQPVHHRCSYCHHRQYLVPPFRRKEVSYTYRFEEHVLRMLIGSNEEEVARRLGISAEMVGLMVRNQRADAQAKQVDPQRVITEVGIDEFSLKKRHKLYATLLTDRTHPEPPAILAMAEGRDEASARKCLEKLGEKQRQGVQTYRADMAQAFHTACRNLLPNARAVVDRFHVAKLFNSVVDRERKKITRAYQAKLTKVQRKEFRSLMWECRRNPKDLSAEEKAKREGLFRELPTRRTLYEIRVRFQTIFDTAVNRRKAHRSLLELFLTMLDNFPELDSFIRTFERWQEEILNYFDARQTSAAVEGINNKARVLVKRAYGLKSADSLWTRLILDLNRAKDVVRYTIVQVQEMVAGFRVFFAPART
jgi:transposase